VTQAPKAQFTSNVTTGKTEMVAVQFMDQSTGTAPMTYKWDFSDGEGKLPENSQKNPRWRFWDDVALSYTVTLTVTNAYGSDTIVKQNYITLDNTPSSTAPAAAFTSAIQSGAAPLTVQFSDQSTGSGLTYAWDFNNDGIVDSTAKIPAYTYQKAGNYSVKLSVTSASGSDSAIKTNYIKVSSGVTQTPTPTPTITPVPTQTPIENSGDCYGAACNPTGNPVGGGAGYSRIVSETGSGVKYVVSTEDQLLTALKNAKSGEVVFVKGSAVIDLSGNSPVTIPAGVTLASNRGAGGSQGALIKKSKGAGNYGWAEPTFTAGGNNVRVTGIRLEGEMYPSTDYHIVSESKYLVGIYSKEHTGLEVDNCEIRGWAWAGVYAYNLNPSGANGMYVHHNYIHYNQARSEGYGVQVDGGNGNTRLFDVRAERVQRRRRAEVPGLVGQCHQDSLHFSTSVAT
jgi:PKD repeat protein